MRNLTLVLSIGITVGMSGCIHQRGSADGIPQGDVWELMLARLRANPDMSPHSLQEATFSVRDSSESVVPDVRYYWGIYHSPYASHRTVVVLGAKWRHRYFVLENPSDWDGLYRTTGWRATTSQQAVQACAELATSSRPRRGPSAAHSVVPGDREFEANVIWGDSIRAFAVGPSALRTTRGWSTALTIIESGKVVIFRCAFPDAGGSSLTPGDSLVGPGYGP